MAYKTPGVYVKEISLFPPSVAEVETAIPAFIGYTEKAERKGEDLTNTPTEVASLLDYQRYFGGEFPIAKVDVKVDTANNYAVDSITIDKRFYLYDSLKLFFDNGGGKCYIVSVGNYKSTIANGDESATDKPGLRVGLKALEKYDEPTMILFPDATLLPKDTEFNTLQQKALSQCATLQDRVGVFDLYEKSVKRNDDTVAHDAAVKGFRNGIGINNLKYGAAYTPWIRSSFAKSVDYKIFGANVKDESDNAVDLGNITSDSTLNGLVTAVTTADSDVGTIEASLTTLRGSKSTIKDRYKELQDAVAADMTSGFNELLGFLRDVTDAIAGWKTSLTGENLTNDLTTYAGSTLTPALEALIALEKNDEIGALSDFDATTDYAAVQTAGWVTVADVAKNTTDYPDTDPARRKAILDDLAAVFQSATAGNLVQFIEQLSDAADTHAGLAQTTLYQGHSIISNIAEHIKRELARVPPSGAIAGVYAFVDNARGVWKAPANVSLNAVAGPVIPLDDAGQEDLNVDVTAGKSVNAIRSFTGKGTLVWGARTLAGNDNEWRYVPVRRFYNMVEESVKKSTAWAVFEPNAAPLWTKVKGMIVNYLLQKWRDGALAGAAPEDAFFVKIGLGETMTSQDILEGFLIVEIGMAVVRPAEFIILKFSHKMQES